MAADLPLLLDKEPVQGPRTITRNIGPSQYAVLIDQHDLAGAAEAVKTECQFWGGVLNPLIPVRRDARSVGKLWERLLLDAEIDGIEPSDVHWSRERIEKQFGTLPGRGFTDTLLGVIGRATNTGKEFLPCRV